MTERSRPDRDRITELFDVLGSSDRTSDERRRAREDLVSLHLPFVRYLANRYAGRGEPTDDLVQIGTVGLLQAIDRFEPGRGLEFATFAAPTIVGEIKRHFRDRSWLVRVPRRLQELQSELAGAVSELSQQLGRSPTVAELAARLGVATEQVLEITESARAYAGVPLDAPHPATGMPIAESLRDPAQPFREVELRQTLRPALAALDERERQVLVLRFVDNKTQSEIGKALGISQVHVSRLLARTLCRLRSQLPDVDRDDG